MIGNSVIKELKYLTSKVENSMFDALIFFEKTCFFRQLFQILIKNNIFFKLRAILPCFSIWRNLYWVRTVLSMHVTTVFPSYTNQSTNLQCKPINWFLYDTNIGVGNINLHAESSTRLLVVSFYKPENIVNLCGFLLFSGCIERNQCKKQPMEVFYRPQTSDPQLC